MISECPCQECAGDCPELTEDGALCIACRNGQHTIEE